MKFGYVWPSGFREVFESVDGRRTDDRGFPYYKLARSLRLRGAKNIAIFSGGKSYYMYGEKLPYLSSDKADVYTYLHASENSVMQ